MSKKYKFTPEEPLSEVLMRNQPLSNGGRRPHNCVWGCKSGQGLGLTIEQYTSSAEDTTSPESKEINIEI